MLTELSWLPFHARYFYFLPYNFKCVSTTRNLKPLFWSLNFPARAESLYNPYLLLLFKIGGRRIHMCLVNTHTHTHNVVLVRTHINIIKWWKVDMKCVANTIKMLALFLCLHTKASYFPFLTPQVLVGIIHIICCQNKAAFQLILCMSGKP